MSMRLRKSCYLLMLSLLTSQAAHSAIEADWSLVEEVAQDESFEVGESIESFMNRFFEASDEVMDEVPTKFDQFGRPVNDGFFSYDQIESGEATLLKERERSSILNSSVTEGFETKALIQESDLAENLVDNADKMVTNIYTMDRRKLKSAMLPEQPWSSDYWPHFKGMTAHRYGETSFPRSNWKRAYKHYLKNPPQERLSSYDKVKRLSPAEKYDLLIGDKDFTLTNYQWGEGRVQMNLYKSVDPWVGICHGWAVASFNFPRPKQAIRLKSYDGKHVIKFYPEDMKALASLLWAYGQKQTKTIGLRCDQKKPKKDLRGRVKDQACFENNPGTFHKVVVNQIGIAKRSFVLDASADYEVWNQPAYAYSYEYFNPQTGKSKHSLQEAVIPYYTYKKDKFKKYRSPNVASVVGIKMNFKYMMEIAPKQRKYDRKSMDNIRTVSYLYDLELDNAGNIIGGEWYVNKHPDFMWVNIPGFQSYSVNDLDLEGEWDSAEKKIPRQWREHAIESSKTGSPLGNIIEKMIEFSSQKKSGLSLPTRKKILNRIFH